MHGVLAHEKLILRAERRFQSRLNAPYPVTGPEPWEGFPAETAPRLLEERVRVSGASGNVPEWNTTTQERSAPLALRQVGAGCPEFAARTTAVIRRLRLSRPAD